MSSFGAVTELVSTTPGVRVLFLEAQVMGLLGFKQSQPLADN